MWMLQLCCIYDSSPGYYYVHWSAGDAQEMQAVLVGDDHLLLKGQ